MMSLHCISKSKLRLNCVWLKHKYKCTTAVLNECVHKSEQAFTLNANFVNKKWQQWTGAHFWIAQIWNARIRCQNQLIIWWFRFGIQFFGISTENQNNSTLNSNSNLYLFYLLVFFECSTFITAYVKLSWNLVALIVCIQILPLLKANTSSKIFLLPENSQRVENFYIITILDKKNSEMLNLYKTEENKFWGIFRKLEAFLIEAFCIFTILLAIV